MMIRPRFRNAALVYNPRAGSRPWRRQWSLARVVGLLEAYGLKISLCPTTASGSATEIAREQVSAGRDLIIVCGGDGTVNEAINGMAGSTVPLALLPAGTANVLAKELGLPWNPWRAAELIPAGIVRRIALGRAGKRYFIAVAGAGADANLVYNAVGRGGPRLGMLSYWLEALRQLLTYPFPVFTVEVEGESLDAALLVVSRTRNYGGPIQLTRQANLFGDDFHLAVFPRRPPAVYWLYFLAQLGGRLEQFPEVRFLRCRRLRALPRRERIRVQVDGELAGELPMEFSLVPDALSLVVPARRP